MVDTPGQQTVGRTARGAGDDGRPILEVEDLRKEFLKRSPLDRLRNRSGLRILALDDVSLSVAPQEALAIVGESGSGKTTLAHSLVRLVRPDAGRIEFHGKDLLNAPRSELSSLRRRIQLVYQDPYTSLNAALRIGEAIVEPALVHGLIDRRDVSLRSEELMAQVGLSPRLAPRYPRALSGGQRQRVAIARALAAEPEILIADEAVSALDVSVQAQVIRLFARLREELGLTLIFVSHQLATVAQLCERVAIMYRGQLVEVGPTAEVFATPRHGYTSALIQAHPGGRRLRERAVAGGKGGPAPALHGAGCAFRHRCAFAVEACAEQVPQPVWITSDHAASCHVLPYHSEIAAAAGAGGDSRPRLGSGTVTRPITDGDAQGAPSGRLKA